MSKQKKSSGAIRKSKLTTSDWQIYTLMLPAAIAIFIFSYLPMWGVVLAFQNYRPGSPMFSITEVDWVGFKWFSQFIQSRNFTRTVINTLRLSLLNLIFGFTTPIMFALILNEVRHLKYKKFVQTASYMPYFISLVVVAGIVLSFISRDGLINNILGFLGFETKEWIIHSDYFPTIYTITNVWKTFGFGSILYFSTLSSIDPCLYESARIDGANRWKQLLHITLPGIQFIIAIQLILQVGHMLESNRDLILLLYNPSNYATSDTIDTFIYRAGIQQGKYSYTAAVGLFKSIIALSLTITANKLSNKITGYGLW